MNKRFYPLFIPSLIGLSVFGLCSRLTASVYLQVSWLQDTVWWIHLILPLVLMGGALALHLTAKGRPAGYLLSYLCNAIGSGCLLGAIYGLRDYIPTAALASALIPAIVLCAAACLMPRLPGERIREITGFILLALAIALVILGIVLWICKSMPFGCAFLFSGLFILPLPLAMFDVGEEWGECCHHLSYSGFGAFILVLSVAAFILSDGDILDGLDLSLDGPEFGGSGHKKGK